MALVRAGDIPEGMMLVRRAVERFDALGEAPQATTALCLAAGVASGEHGRRLVGEVSARLEHTGYRLVDAEVRRVRGVLHAESGDAAAAEAEFDKALSIARGQGARHWELRAATSLARLWRDQGRFADAKDLLSPVYESFEAGRAAPDLIRAGALLREIRQIDPGDGCR
jgi:predicted ATPase